MKTTLRVFALVFAVALCFGMIACGAKEEPKASQTNAPATTAGTEGTEPWVAPADALGKIVAADSTLITWNTYKTEDETIDFMGVKVKELGDADAEMTLFYLESEVTYYKISEGKLVEAAVEDLVAGAIVGVTTLEEGVQEVYIIYTPNDEEDEEVVDDPLEEVVEDTVATTVGSTEEATPDDYVPEDTTNTEGTPEFEGDE